MESINSRAFNAVGYDELSHELAIEFKQGHRGSHFDVPPEVYRSFVNYWSRGRYYNNEIRGRYPYAPF